MTPINNLDAYNAGMRKSMMDKLWFMDKIPDSIDTVFDYGCADGTLLKFVHEMNPNMRLYGYDFSKEMIDKAKINLGTATFFGADDKEANIDSTNIICVASSVFHEIHAYSPIVQKEYDFIFGSNFKYIAIRDMFYSEKSIRKSDPVSLANVYQHYSVSKIHEFEYNIGPLSENKNLLQFFLTYRYKENWDREVRENYFPHSIEQFLAKIPDRYEVVYFDHYTLPFVRDRVNEDFGINVVDPTHAKILLRRKEVIV